ncbi:MAG TPA: response regulator transcription factor [Terriglobales bacterium]
MNDKDRLLVVDDEPDITRVLGTFLGTQGYSVRTADDGTRALKVMREWSPDLIITDLSMPNMGGIAFCREVRKSSSIPIVVLSVREEESAKVEALNCGADDYVTKPFGMDELLARVRAALRRSKQSDHLMTRFEAGDFRVDQEAHTVHVKDREVRLTPKEFQLLTYLIRNAGRVLTPRTLLADVWERPYTEQLDSVRALVRQLRKKIEPNPSAPRYLKTEPWIGYRFYPGD